MADNQMTYSQKILLKILLYALGGAFVLFATGGIMNELGNYSGKAVMVVAAAPTIIALFTFIAFLVSLARSKN